MKEWRDRLTEKENNKVLKKLTILFIYLFNYIKLIMFVLKQKRG